MGYLQAKKEIALNRPKTPFTTSEEYDEEVTEKLMAAIKLEAEKINKRLKEEYDEKNTE